MAVDIRHSQFAHMYTPAYRGTFTSTAAARGAAAICRARAPRAGRDGRAETHKNGHSARADEASILLSALDRENEFEQSSVRSRQISRGRLYVLRLWQYRQNHGTPVQQTALYGGWDCPRSLLLPVCRGLLG